MPGSGGGKNLLRVRGEFDDQISGKLTKIRDNFDRLGKSKGGMAVLQGVGVSAGMAAWNAIGGAVRGASEWIGDAVTHSIDLVEAMNKSRVVFGEAAGKIEAFATAAHSIGMSKLEAESALGTFGNLFKTMGMGASATSDMSIKTVQLAADLSSFHNIDIGEALQKLQSGLVGEAEPMRTLGVLLDEASVKAKAAEMGFGGYGRELTQGEKVQARYAIILEQSSSAQGDFERTAGEAANTAKRLAAETENLQLSIGQKLTPAYQSAQKVQLDFLRGLDYLAYVLQVGDLQITIEEYATQMLRIEAAAKGDYAALVAMGDSMSEVTAASREGKTKLAGLTGQADLLTPALEDVGGAAHDAAEELKDLTGRARTLWEAFSEGTQAATKDEELELRKLPLQIEQAEDEVRRAQKDLENARTHEQKVAARIRLIEAKQDVLRLKGDLSALQAKFAAAGRDLGNAFGSTLYERVVRWNTLTRREMADLGDEKPMPPRGSNDHPRKGALGGRAEGGEPWIVGERGPELFVPSSAGTIVPHGALGQAPVNLVVYLDSEQIAARVERRQYFAAATAPVSVR